LIPVSIITGFLGSGKTTLLQRLLADPRMGETAVLINEFGEVGLDHLLVRKVDEDIVLLNSGCLCCTIRNDLVETLEELWTRRAGGDLMFNRVVIETTGLADPVPIVHTLLTDPSLTPNYELSSILSTLDATYGEQQLDEHPEAVKQAAMADRLIITKTDLATIESCARLRARVSALNPTAPLLSASLEAGPAPPDLFEKGSSLRRHDSADVRLWLNEEAMSPSHGHNHGHDVNRHDDRISAFCIYADEPLRWDVFAEWLEHLLAARGAQLLRIKGLLQIAGRERPIVIQGVQHVFYPPVELADWPDQDRRSWLVFITRDLPRGAVERSFQKVALQPPEAA